MQNIIQKLNQYRNNIVVGWVFIIPALTLLFLFIVLPLFYSLFLVTQSCRGIVCETDFLGNLEKLSGDVQFRQALKNTFIFFIIQVPIMLTLALIFAVILNNPKLKFRGVFRTAIFLPAVTSLVAYSVLFKMMLAPEGIVNTFILFIGLTPVGWLTDPTWQRITIIIALLWRWTGYNMIFYLSGLQSIEKEIFEAAEIDGASKYQIFFKITIPQLKPIILFTTIMSTIGTLQLFDEPFNIIAGSGTTVSTMTLSQYIYNVSFVYTPNFGYAALIAYVIMIIAAVLTVIQFRIARED
jgi:lactose/L-arabinose transport system permease protein